ncbi:hypothetical protein HY411_00410 [Candidatus Gottesmanbacteria bacterium]|nr:hypothetical protein [Candidatus Gottesmanbacteria bacterium]
MIADWVDNLILVYGLHIVSRPQYQLWDKNVDWFAYVVELSVAASYGLYLPFFLLLFWRFVGQFMFMRIHKRRVFIFFPNFFEMAFLWLVIFYPHGGLTSWPSGKTLLWLIAILLFKQLHEIYLHVVLSQHPQWGERFFRWLFRKK